MLKNIGIALAIALCFLIGLKAGPWAQRAYAYAFPEPAYVEGDYASLFASTGQPVVLFTTTTCPWCSRLREHLDQQGIAYHDFQIDLSEQAMQSFRSLQANGVPVVLIGNRRIAGFNLPAIEEALRVAGIAATASPESTPKT
ncbi:glutaredoxin family protein [Pseudomarimonas arenosa]|uniref:Glutaredoxin family protein n=1 Tax=Pseudomarimonas arenosa TaxID=2774145 RepID=A0AAW3ZKX2_9GAMM|nr:glutaredoxin family protein [Pseudomarimonas arenosa]MBD8525086.1 glutaredoxin family protein [Pseudomarimonas arenosa]